MDHAKHWCSGITASGPFDCSRGLERPLIEATVASRQRSQRSNKRGFINKRNDGTSDRRSEANAKSNPIESHRIQANQIKSEPESDPAPPTDGQRKRLLRSTRRKLRIVRCSRAGGTSFRRICRASPLLDGCHSGLVRIQQVRVSTTGITTPIRPPIAASNSSRAADCQRGTRRTVESNKLLSLTRLWL